MRNLFSRFAHFARLRKGVASKQKRDIVSPVSTDPDSGNAHLITEQQLLNQVDGVHTSVEGLATVADNRPVDSANISISSTTSTVASQRTVLESLPAELRCHILAHLANDLGGLNALVSASPVFYKQYLRDRNALLRTGLMAARGNLLVDAYAVEKSALL